MNEDSKIVLILCAGESERWDHLVIKHKQLAPVGGEAILHRTVRLLAKAGVGDPVIVTHCDDLKVPSCRHFEPLKRRWIVETLLHTRPLWSTRNIVLLGDVYFDEADLREVLAFEGPLKVFGALPRKDGVQNKSPEIVALSFHEGQARRVENVLSRAIRAAESVTILNPRKPWRRWRHGWLNRIEAGGGFWAEGVRAWRRFKRRRQPPWFIWGRLWSFYLYWVGLPLDRLRQEDKIFKEVKGLTTDIDRVEEYNDLLRKFQNFY